MREDPRDHGPVHLLSLLVAAGAMAVLSVLDFLADRVGDSLDRRLCEWPRLTDDDPSP